MDNKTIAKTLEQLADLMEFQGAEVFRLRAYRNGARVIRDLPDSIESLVKNQVDLVQFDGIGKGVAAKCKELVETGKLKQLEDILIEVPKSVLDLSNIPRLGPKKAAVLFRQLGIQTLDQLKTACQAGRVRKLKGFGEKTEQAILDGIDLAATLHDRIYWASADELVSRLRAHMTSSKAVQQLEFAGSYRRGLETVGDLDVLVDSENAGAVMDHFAQFEGIGRKIARGDTKMTIRLEDGFQIDLRVVPTQSFGAALQYFTGSKDHNVLIRGLAKKLGLKINEWGVFKVEGQQEIWIAGRTEQEVYEALGLPAFEPEIREARGELDCAQEGKLPQLITLEDICGDLHMHTTATDGMATIQEMAAAARQRGLDYIAITDHSKRVAMANGLNADRLLAQWKEIDQINEQSDGKFWIFKGIECDILEAGGLDLPDGILAHGDWIIASLHYGQTQPRTQITDRIIGAIENPHVTVIAHPTGRILNKRPPYEVDLDAVFQAAIEHNKFLELNANPKRLDLNDIHLIAAKARGIPIVINTDAHQTRGLDDMRYGIKQARRGWLTKKDVVNSQTLIELRKLIGKS